MLQFPEVEFDVLESNNIRVKCKVDLKEPVEWSGSKAILDGSLKLEVLDQNGNVVGEGYYSAPVCDDTTLTKAGFEHAKTMDVLCITPDHTVFKDKNFRCLISPVHLWMIEQ